MDIKYAMNAPLQGAGSAADARSGPLCETHEELAACLQDFDPPISLVEPSRQTTPLVFSSPHSGRRYPEAFLAASPLDRLSIRRSEDAYVDEIFSPMPALGAPLLCAEFPRAFCDVNREAFELDPAMFAGELPAFTRSDTVRVANGLGTIARVVADGAEIYRHKLTFEDARARIDQLYRPYHEALNTLLERTKAQFGHAILVDCHSMPSRAAQGSRPRRAPPPDIVLGDRFGASCDQRLTDALEKALTEEGFNVARNDPFAGGFCTEYYGQPHTGIHAIQIEVKRDLYMNEKSMRRHSGLEKLKQRLKPLVEALSLLDMSKQK
ncbi:MAG: N-formylglutamate amidohydrolase [Alphaproteobacteria bacterium]|nr:MAG: N-formylglutamate amidohydrolase [Alphaproteobacteria bacterium]